MLASLFKSGIAAAALSGMAATGMAFQDQLEWAKSKLMGAPSADPKSVSALSAAITEWRSLRQTNSAPFESYARFLLVHPGWPGDVAMRRAAEASLATPGWSPSTAVAFFRVYPPQTGTSWVRFAEALTATGSMEDARTAARNAWAQGSLTPTDESKVLATWPDALLPKDQDVRMDQLLWQGQTAAAARQLALTSAARRPLFAARLALRTNAPDAGNADAIGAGDPGYLADKAIWLSNTGASASARALLARRHDFSSPPLDVDRWFDLLLRNARAAVEAGDYSTAYNIASQVDDAYPTGTDIALRPLAERDPYTDLVWLAGQTALKRLGRPSDAIGMFVRYTGGSRSTALKSKGFYWAGRAAQAARQNDEATRNLTAAARYGDQFYGQLAAERLGQPLLAPAEPTPPPIPPAERSAFYNNEVVRAAQFLGTVGAHEDQSLFLRQIANLATTVDDHTLADELARTLGRPDLSVMVGRSALLNGVTDYSRSGFPTVNIPASSTSNWTMAHAIMRQESQFDRSLISRAGARGMMQLMNGTAREQAGKLGLAWDQGMLLRSTD